MSLFADLVGASGRVAGTSSRLAKMAELAQLLRRLEPNEVEIALPYLSGDTRQGKLAVGFATLQSARTAPAPAPALTITDVDRAFDALKQLKGKGSAGKRSALLR